jgi:hypothetical protein
MADVPDCLVVVTAPAAVIVLVIVEPVPLSIAPGSAGGSSKSTAPEAVLVIMYLMPFPPYQRLLFLSCLTPPASK